MASRAQLQEWMTRLRDGDRDAFRPVFDFVWPLLRRFVAQQAAGADAEDIAQHALLRLFECADQFDPRDDALSWAFGIAAWEMRTLRKKHFRRRETSPQALLDIGDSAANPEDAVQTAQLHAAVSAVLGSVSRSDFETLTRVANGERLPGATFRKRVERALHRLRLAWSEKHGPL